MKASFRVDRKGERVGAALGGRSDGLADRAVALGLARAGRGSRRSGPALPDPTDLDD